MLKNEFIALFVSFPIYPYRAHASLSDPFLFFLKLGAMYWVAAWSLMHVSFLLLGLAARFGEAAIYSLYDDYGNSTSFFDRFDFFTVRLLHLNMLKIVKLI